jgi:hypothetical protein
LSGAVACCALALFASGAAAVGCYQFHEDCDLNNTCWLPASSGSGSSGTGGGACVPSAHADAVGDDCGVFVSVSAGDDAKDGTKGAPVKTLAKALSLAGASGKPVYACAETFPEALEVPAGMVLYGGLDCENGWRYAGETKRTVLEGPADVIVLKLGAGPETTHIEDVNVRAEDASVDGGSSIAALAEAGANVELVRCELAAGLGRDGAKGATPTDSVGPSNPNDLPIRGANGTNACMGDMVTGNPGGAGTTNALCPTAIGGNGGAGRETMGDDGTDGQPAGAFGMHGTGQPAMGGWNCVAGGGQSGDFGADGAPGAGANALGTLTSDGIAGASGEPGQSGAPGQSGGGGGGAKGKPGCNGASGGGGGAGGCGGMGGLGGQAGGSSIALVSLGASFSFIEVNLVASNAGNGGEGGDPQGGGVGGFGGAGGQGDSNAPLTSKACSGGEGGAGGNGGKGGGGRGGHSLGIAYKGDAPPTDGLTIATGALGTGGIGAAMPGQGADGMKADTQVFP